MNSKILSLCLLGALTVSANAADTDLYTQYFSGVAGGKPCYARIYDDAHMKAHARQTVSKIEVDFDKSQGDSDRPNSAAYFEIGFSFVLKHSHGWNDDAAYCKTAKGYFDCYLDADGGLFHLTPQGNALRLTVINRGGTDAKAKQILLESEGNDEPVGFGTAASDDLVFDIPPADRKFCTVPDAK